MATKKTNLLLPVALGLFALFIAIILISAAASLTPPFASSDKLTVATTIFPLADIASQVGGDRVRVIPILPPGASPHSFSLTPAVLADLQSAQVLFIIGHNLDDWAAQSITRTNNIPIIIVDHNIPLREFSEPDESPDEDKHSGSIDPHYWLTVPNAKQIALNISTELQKFDPENASLYTQRTSRYVEQLDQLEQGLQAQARNISTKEFVAMHDGWSYFARHYGFDLVATYEPAEGKLPSINDIRTLQDLIRNHNIKIFYTEPQIQSTAAARFLSDELGLTIKVLDPIGGLPPRDSYIKLMGDIMNTLAKND